MLGCPTAIRATFLVPNEDMMGIEPVAFTIWLGVGAATGWLAHKFTGHHLGRTGSVFIGALGASISGFLLTRYDVVSASLTGNLIAATVGAVFLLLVLGLLK